MSGSRRRSSGAGEGLPDPEVDITRTAYFARPTVSGGPHMDALLYNQATMMKMLQEMRSVQARGITLEGSKTATRQSFASEVAELMANEEMAGRLTTIAVQWVTAAPANKMAKTHANKNLSVAANATFTAFKDGLADIWDKEDFDNEDEAEMVGKLKAIEESEVKKEDLHIAIAKRMAATGKTSTTAVAEADDTAEQTGSPAGDAQPEPGPVIRGRGRGRLRSRGRGRGVPRATSAAGSATPTGIEETSAGGDEGGGGGGSADPAFAAEQGGGTSRRPHKRPRVEDSDEYEDE